LQLRALLSLAASLLLLNHLSSTQLLAGLRELRFPWLFTALVSMMLRYVELLGQEFQRMKVARAARSAAVRPPSWWWQAGAAGHLAGSLMVRSQHRAQRVHDAMVSRGYNGGPPPGFGPKCETRFWLSTALIGLVLLGLSRWP
jgi:cobalt/nickel transport system permease protein